MSRRLRALFLASLATGCVTSGKYDAAIAELNTCKDDGANQKAAYDALEKSKSELDTRLADITAQLNQATGELRNLGEQSKALQTEKGSLAEAMEKLRAELAELRKQEEGERERAAMFQDLASRLKGMIDAGKLSVYIRNGRMLVRLPDNVLFDPGKTDLKPAGKEALAGLTSALRSIEGRHFQIAGHTDNTPIHTARFPSNWELSAARAIAVATFMIQSGMEPERLSAAGFADNDPVAGNDTPEGKAQNRRIEIELLPNLQELPKLEAPAKS